MSKSKMKIYMALAVVSLFSGNVKLSQDQARRRAGKIHPKKKGQKSGVYDLTAPIQFKVGEEFGYDGDIPKAQAGDLEELKAASVAATKANLDAANQEVVTAKEKVEQREQNVNTLQQALDLAREAAEKEDATDEQKSILDETEAAFNAENKWLEEAQGGLEAAEIARENLVEQ